MTDHLRVDAASRRGVAVVILACALGGAAAPLTAHEIGTTRVVVTFPQDGTYRISVFTDAMALLDKLEAAARQPQSAAAEPGEIQRRLEPLAGLFLERIDAVFDGVRETPAVHVSVQASTDAMGVPAAMVVLSGPRPAGAGVFTWTYGWTFASYALQVEMRAGGEPVTQWLHGGEASAPVALEGIRPPTSRLPLAGRYLALGFTHILPHGLDHVLFVLGVFLLSRSLRSILLQVSAFTVAHSITLGLGMFGLVSVPPAVVEPLIALSIAYVALENLLLTRVRSWRVALVFGFGLLHGLGFAGALREAGLPPADLVTALLGFNLGVELGQLVVITGAFLAVAYCAVNPARYRRLIVVPASAAIACFGVFWTLQRLHVG